ncbi:hypothetical protein MMC21_003492 [Puttea exsequens]|nr:hypothetical protein [Puttea exsequens]
MEVIISPYQEEWPRQFESIKAELAGDLSDEGLPYTSIEHIGSTSVHGLAAKPIIDLLIVIPAEKFDPILLDRFKEALMWGKRQGGYHYNGDGGVQGRWSFKLWNKEPLRHVYVVSDGGLPLRTCLALRDTLRSHEDLRKEYAEVKIALAEDEYENIMQYSTQKNGIVRKILTQAGWTQEEIDEKERQSVKDWPTELVIMSKIQLSNKIWRLLIDIIRASSEWLAHARVLISETVGEGSIDYDVGHDTSSKSDSAPYPW